MTDVHGGTDGNIVQTGYARMHIGTNPGAWDPYENIYETWINGSNIGGPAYSGVYNNISYPQPGWVQAFSINYVSRANEVDYSLTAENVSEVSTVVTPYYATSTYAQYMVEAPDSNT